MRIKYVMIVVHCLFRNQTELAAENLGLRQQLAVLLRQSKRPKLKKCDRDGVYGKYFQQRVTSMDVEEVITAPRSPWQNPYVKRLIGSIRRECLNHVIVLNERHLKRILDSYFDYYHNSRTHLSLDRISPMEREVEPPERGRVIAIPQVGGLHHRYRRAASYRWSIHELCKSWRSYARIAENYCFSFQFAPNQVSQPVFVCTKMFVFMSVMRRFPAG